jgi:hypothetical protein
MSAHKLAPLFRISTLDASFKEILILLVVMTGADADAAYASDGHYVSSDGGPTGAIHAAGKAPLPTGVSDPASVNRTNITYIDNKAIEASRVPAVSHLNVQQISERTHPRLCGPVMVSQT